MIKNETGRIGENIACSYLVERGWQILDRNYRRKSDEIDIIAIAQDKTLVFFEVKTLMVHDVAGTEGLMPEDNLTPQKFRRISRACEFFARENLRLIDEEKGWRIDLLAIDVGPDGKPSDIHHYENI